MGFTLVGLLLLSAAHSFAIAAAGRGAGGHRLGGVPSGILARRAHGLGRPARPGAVAVPGRRQRRLGARPAARGVHRAAAAASAASPGSRLLALLGIVVLMASAAGTQHHGLARLAPRAARGRRRAAVSATRGARRDRGAAGADLLEVFLSGEPHQLLHLLSDPRFPRVGARARSCICSSSWPPSRSARSSAARSATASGARYVIWVSILGVLPFTLVLPHANLFWTGRAHACHRPHSGLRLPGHRGLCAGADARQVGMVAGLFFGFAFGMGGIGAAVLGSSPTRPASSSSTAYAPCCPRRAPGGAAAKY